MKRRSLLALAVACVALLQLAATANAKLTYQTEFGSAGTGAGQFRAAGGVAINHSTGDVYVVDRGNNRIQQFTADGDFIRAWGYDVVASGGNDKPYVDEVNAVKIRATGGSFKLTFEGQSTGPLAYNASAAEVQTALNGLSTISSGGGSVSVSGGPGDATGSNPGRGHLQRRASAGNGCRTRDRRHEPGAPAGTELTCTVTGFLYGSTGTEYQWLANGEPIAGATSQTFTPGAGEAGKAIQCHMRTTYKDGNQTRARASPSGSRPATEQDGAAPRTAAVREYPSAPESNASPSESRRIQRRPAHLQCHGELVRQPRKLHLPLVPQRQ